MAATASKATGTVTWTPTNKVIGAGLSGAIVAIAVYGVDTFAGVHIPPEIASALTVVVSAAAAYLTPPSIDQTTM